MTDSANPKIVLDTNIWIGAMVATLMPERASADEQCDAAIVAYARTHFDIVFTHRTMDELGIMVLNGEQQCTQLNAHTQARERLALLNDWRRGLRPYAEATSPLRCKEDVQDQKFLDACYGAQAHILLSRDAHLLNLAGKSTWLDVLHPRDFARAVMTLDGPPELGGLKAKEDALRRSLAAVQAAQVRVERRVKEGTVGPALGTTASPALAGYGLFSEPKRRTRTQDGRLIESGPAQAAAGPFLFSEPKSWGPKAKKPGTQASGASGDGTVSGKAGKTLREQLADLQRRGDPEPR